MLEVIVPLSLREQSAEALKATVSCGHEVDVGPGKPGVAAQRLKQLAGQPCIECKRRARQEREAAEQEGAVAPAG